MQNKLRRHVVLNVGRATKGGVEGLKLGGRPIFFGNRQREDPCVDRGVYGPAKTLLCSTAFIEGLTGNIGILNLKPRKGADGIIGQGQIDRDDDREKTCHNDKNLPAGQFWSVRLIAHCVPFPLKTVSL